MKYLLLLPLLVSCGFEIVDTGHVGVKTQFGKIIEHGLPEGLHFYMPFSGKTINEVDARIKKESNDSSTFTKDIQEVKVSYAINYQIDATKSDVIYRNGNQTYIDNVLNPIILGELKEVIGQYQAETIVSQRPKVNQDVFNAVKTKLAAKHIMVSNFEITNFDFNDEFEKSIEAKMVATQKSLEAANYTKQVKEEKEQATLKAQGEAEAMRIKANALTQNKALVEYEAIQKWNGVLPNYMMGNLTPFINLNK